MRSPNLWATLFLNIFMTLPTEIKKAQGTYRAHRENSLEPFAPQGFPTPSYELDKVAQKHFDTVCKQLSRLKVLTTMDGISITELAYTMAELEKIRKTLKKGKIETITDRNGNTYRRQKPETKVERDLWQRYILLLREHGLSGPIARAKLKINQDYESTEVQATITVDVPLHRPMDDEDEED